MDIDKRDELPLPTFFTSLPHSFVNLTSGPEGAIPTVEFLECCREIPKILDILGAVTLSPVKSDVNGNIAKLGECYADNPTANAALQQMIMADIGFSARGAGGKATEALLWLKRGLHLMAAFLRELLDTEKETTQCLNVAYERVLKRHHNFFVQQIFKMVSYAIPSRDSFVASLTTVENAKDPKYVKQIMVDARQYTEALERVLSTIDALYKEQKLE